jgi:hypothetical protein
MMTRIFPKLALLLTLVTIGSACNFTPSTGRFEAESFHYGNCGESVLPWEPAFFAVNEFDDARNDNTVATIRLQDQGGGIELVDGIFIQVDDGYVKRAGRGVEIPLGLPDDEGYVPARATMGFYATCPDEGVIPEMRGTIRFGFYDTQNDGQVTARVFAPVVVNRRVCEARGDEFCEAEENRLGTNLTGEFSFIVEGGRPYQNFTGPRND